MTGEAKKTLPRVDVFVLVLPAMRKKISMWHAQRGRARADALDLVGEHGPLAYAVACRLARSERIGRPPIVWLPSGHWARVRREVKRTPPSPPQSAARDPDD